MYGSDSTGTLTGADSIALGAYTIQTSTVYGGAGADTIFVGDTSGDDNLAVQILKADIKGFAGNDSIAAGGSFVSTTVSAGEGNDTIFVNATSGSESASTEFYAGAGNDFVSAMNGQQIAIYGDASSTDTAGGNDSLSINGLTSSTVYGAAGGDTLIVVGGTNNRFDLGNEMNYATGNGAYVSSTLLGGTGSDSLYLNGSTLGYVDAGAGADSITFEGVVVGSSTTTMATILGGTGSDTLDFNASVQYATILGGTDSASQINFASTVDESTVRGGSGADTLTVTGKYTSSLFAGAAAADIFTFSTGSTGSSIIAGAGNDSVTFASVAEGAGNTYYFGKTDGKDTLALVSSPQVQVSPLQLTPLMVQLLVSSTAVTLTPVQVLQAPSPSTTLKVVLQLEPCSSTMSLEVARLRVLVSPTSPSSRSPQQISLHLADRFQIKRKLGVLRDPFFCIRNFPLGLINLIDMV